MASTVAQSSPPLNSTTAFFDFVSVTSSGLTASGFSSTLRTATLKKSLPGRQVPALANIHRRRNRIAFINRCLDALLQHTLRLRHPCSESHSEPQPSPAPAHWPQPRPTRTYASQPNRSHRHPHTQSRP